MKLPVLIGLLFGVCNVLFAQSQLEVVVKGVKNDDGKVRVGIFNDKETFLEEAIYGKVVNAQKGEITVLFDMIPPGIYALSAVHDENENGDIDYIFGIPREGFGFSNDAMGTFGPPSFKKASITVEPGKMSINIAMRYL